VYGDYCTVVIMWTVLLHPKVVKGMQKIPVMVQRQLAKLAKEIETSGPVRGNWPNYSNLSGVSHHCHLKKGHPTFVACWAVTDRTVRLVEIFYAGTHEKAPY
jgi:mRNA-degrading endonuclease RelE of RelBE toxin-antitoxin system